MAKILKSRLRSSDIIARFGGEEFIVALVGCNLKTSGEIAEYLRKKIEKSEIKYKNRKIKFTASLALFFMKRRKV